MSSSTHRARSAVAVAFGLAVAVPLLMASPAAAHDDLLGSSPAVNESFATAPEEVSLSFSDEVLMLGAKVLVVGDDDTDWASGEAVLDGTDVSAKVQPGMPDGAYEVRWRVVSSDGHPIAGVIPFTVGDVGAAPGSGSAVADGGAGEASATDTDAGDAATDAVEASDSDTTSAVWRTALIALGGAAVAVLIWLIFLAWRRRRSRTLPSPAAEALPDDIEHSKGS